MRPGTFGAAWGRPAILLRCGVAQPTALTPASECVEVNGVGWFDEPAEGGRIYTTIGRPTFVEVGVPTDTPPESMRLIDLADRSERHDPLSTALPADRPVSGSAEADGTAEGEGDQLVDQFRIGTPLAPTSAGTSSAG